LITTGICGLPCSVGPATKRTRLLSLSKRSSKAYTEDMYRVRFATAEALFSGVTTVHDLITMFAPYAKAAIRALTDTGIRPCLFHGYKLSHQKKLRTLTVLQLYANRLQTLNRIYCHWDLPHARFLSIRCIAAIGKWHVKWDLITVHANFT